MREIAVVGTSWKHGTPSALGALTIARDERGARLPQVAHSLGVSDLVYLATCNRVEVTFSTPDANTLETVRRRLAEALTAGTPNTHVQRAPMRAWHGESAAEHLFLVAAGLDSARVGESEIAGQMRDAIEQSRAVALLSHHVEHVYAEALKAARSVRPLTEGHNRRVSLADIAIRHLQARLARTRGAVALVGVSAMTERAAADLARAGYQVIVVNRTLARAEPLAVKVGGISLALEAFRAAPPPVEAVLLATSARTPVLQRSDLERIAARTPSGESPLIIDLGVPPNVSPDDASAADLERIGMDEISTEAARDRERALMGFAEARALIDEALASYRRSAAERLVGPAIAQLRQRYRHTALEGVERLFQRELASLGPAERDAVRRWAETLARRFAHVPAVGLRDVASEAGPAAVQAFFSTTAPEIAATLRKTFGDTGMDLHLDGNEL
jgi:glutamyl-tRNA reductase